MKKLIYGALLVALGMPAFQSCIDDKESASVTGVRDAKAAELRSKADWYSAQATAEATLAAAEKAKADAETKRAENEATLAEAQAAYQQAQANYEQALADAQTAENERIAAEAEAALAAAKAEYEALKAKYAADQAQWEAEQQKWENELLQQQIDNIKYQQELADAEGSVMKDKIAALMDEYLEAAKDLKNAREEVYNATRNLNSAINGTFTNESMIKMLQSSNEKLENEIAQYEAQIAVLEKYAEYTPEELQPAINEAYAEMLAAYDVYSKAQAAANEAAEYTDPDNTTSAYNIIFDNISNYYEAYEELVHNARIILGPLGIEENYRSEDFESTSSFDEKTLTYSMTGTTAVIWWQPGTPTTANPNPAATAVTLFTNKGTDYTVYKSIVEGVAMNYWPEAYSYNTIADYYTINTKGVDALITYLDGLKTEAQNDAKVDGKVPEGWTYQYDSQLAAVKSAYADMKAEQTNIASIVTQRNAQAKNAAVTAYQASLDLEEYLLVKEEYDTLVDIQNGIDPANYTVKIAALQKDIQNNQDLIESNNIQLAKLYNNTATEQDNIAYLKDVLALAQANLEYCQDLYDSAKAALDAAIAAANE